MAAPADLLPKAYTEASERLTAKHALLEETYRYLFEGRLRFLDPEILPKRVERLLKNPLTERRFAEHGVVEELRTLTDVGTLSPAAQSELERTIEGADFMPIWFLSRGAELRRTVALVRARTASGQAQHGTGFLVGPRLLLTNFHVLDWSDIGQNPLSEIVPHTLVDFDHEERFDGGLQPSASFRLDPATLLLASPWDRLDYVLVAVRERSEAGGVAIGSFGYNRLAGDLGKISKGEPVFVIQHPNGLPKQVVVQNNRLIDRDEALPYLTYEADTARGSSGSPVFNRQWEVVALHHSAEIARDGQGRILARDGSVWVPEAGSAQVQFLGLNEGVRISRILADWAAKRDRLRANAVAGAPDSVERCSPEGLSLLSQALQTHLGALPTDLIDPAPAARPPAAANRPSGGFPRPD